MLEHDARRRLEEIQTLRRQGLLSQKEAYEQHMGLIGAFAPQAVIPAAIPGSPAGSMMSTSAVAAQAVAKPQTYGTPGVLVQVAAIAIALLGGAFGVPGAFVQELYAGGGILLAFTGAPIIEEALKPAGVYFLLAKWPQALASQLHIAMLAALGGLCFGAIESFVYVTVYYPASSGSFVLFRFTVPLLMHATASFIVGLGLSRGIFNWAANGAPLPRSTRNCYLTAVALHATYNIVITVLSVSGIFGFK